MQDPIAGSNPSCRRVPWNKGKLTGAKPTLRPKHVCSFAKWKWVERVKELGDVADPKLNHSVRPARNSRSP